MVAHHVDTKQAQGQPDPTGSPPDTPASRAWLNRIAAGRRSATANWFHHAARAGATPPQAVCSGVWQTVQRRLEWASTPDTREFLQGILDLLKSHQDEAMMYAQSVLDYEALPYEQRQQVKARRALNFVMGGKPTTEKQASLIRSKGYTGAIPADWADASALIDRLLRQAGDAL